MLQKTVCLFIAELNGEAWVLLEVKDFLMTFAVAVLRTREKILSAAEY